MSRTTLSIPSAVFPREAAAAGMVVAHGFAARRRLIRSSKTFRTVLACGVLFVLALMWLSERATYPSSQRVDLGQLRRVVSGATMTLEATGDHVQEIVSSAGSAQGASVGAGPDTRQRSMSLRIVTFNIRYATSKPVLGEQPWDVRCSKLCAQLRLLTAGHENPFLCLQEALYPQVQDVQAELGDSWSYIGFGREDGSINGEFSPIFYRSDVWYCERNETRWLSRTPDRPSRGWDAAHNRIVTMGEFLHKTRGTKAVVMSTHFDHVGVRARENSARLLLQFAAEWARRTEPRPSVVLIGGDFNSATDDAAYKIMTAAGSGMSDISDLVPESKRYGNYLTYTSFGEAGAAPSRIDFLFLQEPSTSQARTYGVTANSFDDQVRVSDHRAVVADMDVLV